MSLMKLAGPKTNPAAKNAPGTGFTGKLGLVKAGAPFMVKMSFSAQPTGDSERTIRVQLKDGPLTTREALLKKFDAIQEAVQRLMEG